MNDGVRWTLIGGIIGLVLLFLASLIYYKLLILLPPAKFNWGLAISIAFPVYSGVLVWGVKLFDKKNKDEVKQIYKEIDKKADQTEIKRLELYVNDHKETNDAQFDAIHEFMISIDNKLDIIISNKK